VKKYLVVTFIMVFLNASCSKDLGKPTGGNQTDVPGAPLLVCVKDFLDSDQAEQALSIMDSDIPIGGLSDHESPERRLALRASVLIRYVHQQIGLDKTLEMVRSGLIVGWFGNQKVDFCMNRIGV
jgi:hypothetical protein